MNIEKKLNSLGYRVPEFAPSANQYIAARLTGNLIFVSGSTPMVDGKLTCTGKVGGELTLEQGQEAGCIALVNCLAKCKSALGSLDRVKTIIKLNGYVASAPGFFKQPAVMNAASSLLADLYGESGRHARTVIGVPELPGNAPVEVELIAEFE